MATLAELAALLEQRSPTEEVRNFRAKIRVATMMACEDIRQEVPGDPINPTETEQERKRYAQRTLGSVSKENMAVHPEYEKVYRAVILQNSGAPYAAIIGASDNQIHTAVANAITFFADRFPDPLPGP